MAPEDRTAAPFVALEQALQATPYKFSFFQALRRLETVRRDLPRVGRSVRPAEDAVRVGQDPSLDFAPATLSAYIPAHDGRPSRMVTSFFGMFGPNGPLPLHLTEFARDRLRNSEDPAFARFVDLFHHRLLSLFYRAWADAQPAVQFDRSDTDRFSDFVSSLFGLGAPALANRDACPDIFKRHHAGTLACQTRHADGLRNLLADYFRIPVALDEFVSHWMELPDECQTSLGRSPHSGRLGQGAILGQRVWECQYKFRIEFGPLQYDEYNRFLPGGLSLAALGALVRNYIGDELEWELRLILKKSERPPLVLGRSGRLSRSAWVANRPAERDLDDLVLNPLAISTPSLPTPTTGQKHR